MNLLNIKTFLNIVRYQSISGAAQAMYTSQPTVSARLSQLEEELGFQLVKRNKGQRTIELTSRGEAFVPLAEHWMELDSRTMQFCQESEREILSLAAPGSLQEHVVPHIVHKLMDGPNPPQIRLRTVGSAAVYSAVANREVDVGLALRFLHQDGAVSIPMFDEDWVLICPADTPLPEGPVRPEQLEPHYEVRVTSWTGGNKMWHDRNWDPHIPPYVQVDNNHMTHNYMTHPRCWAVCPTSVALSVVERSQGALVMRRLDPGPSKHVCYLVTLNSQLRSKPELIGRLQSCILEYAAETHWLRPIYGE